MAQKTGALIFDEQTDRYDIRFDIADYYGGLHCGECFDVCSHLKMTAFLKYEAYGPERTIILQNRLIWTN